MPKEIHAILTETLACFHPGLAKDVSVPGKKKIQTPGNYPEEGIQQFIFCDSIIQFQPLRLILGPG